MLNYTWYDVGFGLIGQDHQVMEPGRVKTQEKSYGPHKGRVVSQVHHEVFALQRIVRLHS